jgi:anti-sigma28 factor (negative regulator of flagellin synthesis)
MSIQIYNDGIAGAAASGAGRTQELSQPPAGGKPSSGSTVSGEDTVQISSLSSGLSSHQSERAARVQQLAAAYQSGQYEVNSMDVSKALVNHALQAGTTGGEQ